MENLYFLGGLQKLLQMHSERILEEGRCATEAYELVNEKLTGEPRRRQIIWWRTEITKIVKISVQLEEMML